MKTFSIKKVKTILAVLSLLWAPCVLADLYVAVNDPNASDEACEGRGTEALPYKTIQAAVVAAESDDGVDTIRVKPGVYAEGTTKSPTGNTAQDNRVVLTKKIHLVSTDGAKVTEIRGKHGTEASCGLGPDSVRAVLVTEAAAGSIVEGFTLGNGATAAAADSANPPYCGGGLLALASAYLVDSVVTNCVGTMGGGLFGGTAVRGFFKGCGGRWWDSGVAHTANLWNCVVYHDYFWITTYAGEQALTKVTNVNCTVILDNRMYAKYNDCRSYNLLSLSFMGDETVSAADPAKNCVFYKDAKTNRICSNPFSGDFRLLHDSVAHGAGDAQWLESVIHLPDSIARTDFTGTDLTGLTGSIAAGASQQDHLPAYGGVVLSTDGYGSVVDGIDLPKGGYLFAETWPVRWMVADWPHKSPVDSAVPPPAIYMTRGGNLPLMFPTTDGRFSLIPSRTSGELCSLWRCPVQERIWADAENGSDTTGDGTEANPYKTLQTAVDAQTKNYAIICAKPGRYDEGGKEKGELFCRVARWNANGKVTLIRGVEGPERTFLVGATNATANIRCASLCSDAFLQGFTLTDGRACGETTAAKSGAAIYDGSLYDCVVSNCVATSFLTYQAEAHRVRFVGNTCGSAFHYGNQTWSWCAFANNTVTNGTMISGAGNPRLYNCTFAANDTGVKSIIANDNVEPNNCILEGMGGPLLTFPGSGLGNNIYWNATLGSPDSRYVLSDPRLLRKDANDFHPTIGSGALGTGDLYQDLTYMSGAYHYATADVYGNHFAPLSSGRVHMGAVQEGFLCEYAVNPPPFGGLALEGATFGTNALAPGESVTLTISKALTGATRDCIGVIVKDITGVLTTILFADLPGGVWTKTISSDPSESLWIDAYYSPDWYVDIENGDDANDGFTAESAKKTLVGVTTNASLRAGDVVHVAPGTYETETAKSKDDSLVLCRVVIPEGVTVASTGGKTVTVIKGAKAPTSEGGDGCGEGAVRCAYLKKNAKLIGFTLTGGRARLASTQEYPEDSAGGGVCAANKSAEVIDCLFTDCKAETAVGSSATFVRCRMDNCGVAGGKSYVLSDAVLRNCLVNKSGDSFGIRGCTIYNSTVLPTPGWHCTYSDASTAYDSILLGFVNGSTKCTGCVIATGDGYTTWGGSVTPTSANVTDCVFTNVSALGLSSTDWKPTSSDSLVVDAARAEARASAEGSLDLVGVPRVLNGALDIGAYEWDWRPTYAQSLGRFVTVDDASPDVVETADGEVRLDGDGTHLTLTLSSRMAEVRDYVVPYSVSGSAVLNATVNGRPLPAVSGSGDLTFTCAGDVKLFLSLEGDGAADIGRITRSGGMMLLIR